MKIVKINFLATDMAQDVTIKNLAKGNPTMGSKFAKPNKYVATR